jgi:hypothetical protein
MTIFEFGLFSIVFLFGVFAISINLYSAFFAFRNSNYIKENPNDLQVKQKMLSLNKTSRYVGGAFCLIILFVTLIKKGY